MLQRKNSGKGKGESMNDCVKMMYIDYSGEWPFDRCESVLIANGKNGSTKYYRVDEMGRSLVDGGDDVFCHVFRSDFNEYGESLEKEWMPEVGQECEYLIGSISNNGTYVGKNARGSFVVECKFGEYKSYHPHQIKFRPIKTDRDKFIEQAIDDYLVQVGSDAVNPEWYGRIFGAMYDAGYRKNET